MRTPLAAALAIVLAFGCTDQPLSTSPDATALRPPDAALSINPGCYAVKGRILQSGFFPNFSGTISGDIQGNVVTQLDPSSVTFAGNTQHLSGQQTWDVTGGTVNGLTNVTLAFDGITTFVQAPRFGNNATVRVVAGAAKGNLTYHGVIDVSGFPVVTDVQYNGVICP